MSKRKSIKLGTIVRQFGGELVGDSDITVQQVASLETARPTEIAFLAQPRNLPDLRKTRAGAVILGPDVRNETRLPRIVTANPYAYFARVSALFNSPVMPKPGRHRSAVIDKTARIAKSASIAACVVVGKGVKIAGRANIGPGCYIGDDVAIGTGTQLHANVTLYAGTCIGARCIVHSGAVIGADGFGIAREDGAWRKIPQIGRVLIGDDVEIGANTTIDRGALDNTIIEDGVKLDNQIQIAHNVQVGAHTAIAGCVGIAGSARIGRNCTIGGGAAIIGHIKITDNVIVSACTLITKSLLQPGTYTGAFPASSHKDWLKNAVYLRQLDDLARRVRKLEGGPGKAREGNS